MFEKMSRSWELVKASYAVLRQDREMLLFPLLSMIGTIIVTILFIIPLASTGIFEAASTEEGMSNSQSITAFVIAFLFYFVTYTVIIFSNVAIDGMAMMRLRGEDPTVKDGFRIASEHINVILGYAAISATIGMILNAIRGNEDNIIGQIVAGLIGTAWNLITFLVIPVLVIEGVGPIEGIKRSGSLLKSTWGENVVGSFAMGIISFLVMLGAGLIIGLPLFLIASATNSGIIIALAVAVIVLMFVAIGLFFSALNSIFTAALYNYATGNGAGEFFPESMISGAFTSK